jgi:hypothetical protein
VKIHYHTNNVNFIGYVFEKTQFWQTDLAVKLQLTSSVIEIYFFVLVSLQFMKISAKTQLNFYLIHNE